jgi:hypothetical protein
LTKAGGGDLREREIGFVCIMAIPSAALVAILRETADRLAEGADYRWSHFGRCNCGHLVQTVTRLSPAEIHAVSARELVEWSEIPEDYCVGTGLPLEYVLDRLRELGLDRGDLRHLEDLSDPEVLAALPGGHRWLARNERHDAVIYFCTLANVLASKLPTALAEGGPWESGAEIEMEAARCEPAMTG